MSLLHFRKIDSWKLRVTIVVVVVVIVSIKCTRVEKKDYEETLLIATCFY